uniref:Uncharacterized protein n=1 Tax=Phaseolus vulgaris TaxID=3885 RepID=V7ANM8_PHAVU|nr:hypothetical protein PHAVU_010G027600g [Phaseolus vulgaris]ESW06188.1 hypothetical protein PHAVU_010G027600g [Phaseolus vulgaris]
MSNLGSGDKVEIFVTFGQDLVIKSTAVYLIYERYSESASSFRSLDESLTPTGKFANVCAERSGEEISRNAESQQCWCEGTYVIYADFLQADEVIGSLESAYLFLSK